MSEGTVGIKRAELTSVVGAGVLGAGLGTLLAVFLRPYVAVIILLGVAMHGFGMWRKHRLERDSQAIAPWWDAALYWVCWIGLAVVVVLAVWRR